MLIVGEKAAANAVTSSVTVTVVAQPSITCFVASAATMTEGSSIDLSAVLENVTASINNSIGLFSSSVAITMSPISTVA